MAVLETRVGWRYVLLIRNGKQLNTIVLFLYYVTLMMTDFRLYFPIDICVTSALWGMSSFKLRTEIQFLPHRGHYQKRIFISRCPQLLGLCSVGDRWTKWDFEAFSRCHLEHYKSHLDWQKHVALPLQRSTREMKLWLLWEWYKTHKYIMRGS